MTDSQYVPEDIMTRARPSIGRDAAGDDSVDENVYDRFEFGLRDGSCVSFRFAYALPDSEWIFLYDLGDWPAQYESGNCVSHAFPDQDDRSTTIGRGYVKRSRFKGLYVRASDIVWAHEYM